jgi:hypothetical protein
VVIINNTDRDQIKYDKEFSKAILKNKHDCHVVITVDYNDINQLKNSLKINKESILLKSKPLYIPQLLVDIYPYALNYHNVFAFENAFVRRQRKDEAIVHSDEIFYSDPVFED